VSIVPASATITQEAAARPRSWSLARVLLVPATMIVILAVALLILMTPFWTHPAVGATATSIVTPEQAIKISDLTINELIFGPGTFQFGNGGVPYFTPDEAGHMRDVRVVFYGFMVLAIASVGLLAWQLARHPRDPAVWRSVSRGGIWLVGALIVLGVFAALAFDAAFELFHRIFFPGGNWAFPVDSLLIRIYPYEFWEWSAAVMGAIGIGAGLVVWRLARRRAESLEHSPRE
jgi:integral membrane protein (TIGR01906 family)